MLKEHWTIAADRIDDPNISPNPSYRVRRRPGADWEIVSDEIHGYQHEPGVEVDIEVETSTVPEPPADASSLRYDLIRVIKRQPKR